MPRADEDNKIHFLIERDGRVKYRIAQSTSYEMQIHLKEIAQETKRYIEDLPRKKFPNGFRS